MATSGTIATTTITTATLIEHALARIKLPLTAQTPEVIQKALDNLYFLLLNLSNNGLNLWCVDRGYLGLTAGKAKYDLPSGTLDVLNVIHSTPTIETSTFAAIVNGGSAELDAATEIVRVGFTVSAAFTGALTIKKSTDGVTYTTVQSVSSDTYSADVWYYVDLPGATSDVFFSVTGASAPVDDIRLISASYDLPLTQWNRDTWSVINHKDMQSHPATNYFFEKKVTPSVTLWPVPDVDTNYMMFYRHRQIQDIGTLIQQVEIPQRWLEGIIWQLALRMAFEIPEVDPGIIPLITQMADRYEFEAELSETDGSSIYLTPMIRGYTR